MLSVMPLGIETGVLDADAPADALEVAFALGTGPSCSTVSRSLAADGAPAALGVTEGDGLGDAPVSAVGTAPEAS